MPVPWRGVNQHIIEARGEAGGGEPNDLLDERERLLNELAKRVDISVVPQDDGAWNVFIGKGQSLVMGVKAATLTTQRGGSDLSQLDITFTSSTGSRVITDQLDRRRNQRPVEIPQPDPRSGSESAGLAGDRHQ